MRTTALLLAPLLLASACGGPGLNPNSAGVYSLPSGQGLTITSASGPGKCDWWSEKDHDLSADDAPGFCLADVSVTSGDIFYDEDHEAYAGSNVEVTTGGIAGEITRIRFTNVGSGGWLTFDLLVGDNFADADIVTLDVKAKRYRP